MNYEELDEFRTINGGVIRVGHSETHVYLDMFDGAESVCAYLTSDETLAIIGAIATHHRRAAQHALSPQ